MAGFQINFVILKQAYLGAGFNFFNSEIGNLTLLPSQPVFIGRPHSLVLQNHGQQIFWNLRVSSSPIFILLLHTSATTHSWLCIADIQIPVQKHTTSFSLNRPTGPIQSKSRHFHLWRVCLSVCLWLFKTTFSGGRGDLWLKGVSLILACNDTIFFFFLFWWFFHV